MEIWRVNLISTQVVMEVEVGVDRQNEAALVTTEAKPIHSLAWHSRLGRCLTDTQTSASLADKCDMCHWLALLPFFPSKVELPAEVQMGCG